jgi:hypothetical protein
LAAEECANGHSDGCQPEIDPEEPEEDSRQPETARTEPEEDPRESEEDSLEGVLTNGWFALEIQLI